MDVPAEFAFGAAHAQSAVSEETAVSASEAGQAEFARLSKVAEFASAAVEAHVAKVSEAAERHSRGRAQKLKRLGNEPPRFVSGSVRALQKGRASALEFHLDTPVCLRVFDVREDKAGGKVLRGPRSARAAREPDAHARSPA